MARVPGLGVRIMPNDHVPLIEEAYCPDIFVSGIGKIEKLTGGMVRITFFSERRGEGGRCERVVSAKIVRPLSTWPQAMRMLAMAIADVGLVVMADGSELMAETMN